jgi:hypothetical protein
MSLQVAQLFYLNLWQMYSLNSQLKLLPFSIKLAGEGEKKIN